MLISLYFRIDRQTNFEINMIFILKVMLNHFIVAFEPMKSLISEMTPKSIRGKFPKIILVINNFKKIRRASNLDICLLQFQWHREIVLACLTYCSNKYLFLRSYSRTRDIHTCYRAFDWGIVTTCFNDLGLSWLKCQHLIFDKFFFLAKLTLLKEFFRKGISVITCCPFRIIIFLYYE